MSQLRWPDNYQDEASERRVVVVPRTPNYDHPYAQRVPKPPPRRNQPVRERSSTVAAPAAAPRRNPAKLGLILAIGAVVALCGAAYFVMSGDYKADYRDQQAVRADLRNAPVLTFDEETPGEFIKSLDITSVRLASDQSRASINGQIFRVGDIINEQHGLVFAGHDPDGEYLLFKDSVQRVHLYSLFQE